MKRAFTFWSKSPGNISGLIIVLQGNGKL